MDVANNIWHIAPVPPRTIDHPCPYPEEIPARLIALYSYAGDLILDPFLGSGQTAKVAAHLGRDYVGYDIQETYIRLAAERIATPLAIRPQQLVAVFEKVPLHAPLKNEWVYKKGRRYKRKPNETASEDLFAVE